MKIIKKDQKDQKDKNKENFSNWKVLIVDDEIDVHVITKISLKNFSFDKKNVEFLDAFSANEAKQILQENQDISVVLIDVVMENENAGLDLVKFIREHQKNNVIRLIVRTGQPGTAPERFVIDHYDIDDYKEKTELTAQRLYTTLRSAIKAYRDIKTIEANKQGLEKILNAAPNLYSLKPMEQFFEGVLNQMIGFCNLGANNFISATTANTIANTTENTVNIINGFLATIDNKENNLQNNLRDNVRLLIRVGTGRFSNNFSKDEIEKITNIFLERKNIEGKNILYFENSLFISLKANSQINGFIYIEDARLVVPESFNLLEVMANQCGAALENIDLYDKLEQANKRDKRKNQFIGMAAHDLGNPISSVSLALDILRPKIINYLNKDEIMFLDLAQQSCDFSMQLVSDLLDIAVIESGKLELDKQFDYIQFAIKNGIEANKFSANAKNIEILFDFGDSISSLPIIKIDSRRIMQVVSNLISNAIKYSNSNTKIYVNVSKQSQEEILFYVKDEGQGIPEEEIKKLFKPFSKTRVQSTAGELSTGLGLVICKKIIQAHGGRIWVESKESLGSTFFVALPIK